MDTAEGGGGKPERGGGSEWMNQRQNSSDELASKLFWRDKASTVLNFPLLPHGLPLSASLQFLEKLAEKLSTTYRPYSLTQ